MKATLRLEDGREIKVEISENDVENLTKSDKKTGWERVKPKEFYFCICSDGQVSADEDEGDDIDKHWYTTGNYFSDEQLANDQARAISLWLHIKRWAAEHCEPVDCEGCSGKYSFYWDYVAKQVRVSGVLFLYRTAFAVYFDTEEHVKQCIEEFQDELTWYFTECKDRMDG